MRAYNAKVTIENIKVHFKKSGLTVEIFANILEVSKRWLEYILAGEKDYEFAPETVQKACDFFITDFGKFTTKLQNVPDNYRTYLQQKHSRNTEYTKILSDAPSVPFIIEEILINDSTFIETSGLQLNKVKDIINDYYPNLKLTNLSNDLQNSDFIEFRLDPKKVKKTYLYKKK